MIEHPAMPDFMADILKDAHPDDFADAEVARVAAGVAFRSLVKWLEADGHFEYCDNSGHGDMWAIPYKDWQSLLKAVKK